LLPLISGPANELVSDEIANQVIQICDKYKAFFVKLYSDSTKYSAYMRHFDDNMNFVPEKTGRINSDCGAVRCVNVACRHANAVSDIDWCVACESKLPL
ncbi:hypothetical protein HK096_009547, partial [Nowakowskiella sp. JEL0078]